MPLKNKKVLITCGPTWVPIDDVRVISNQSTGELGHLLAEAFHRARAQVTILDGPCTHTSSLKGINIIKFHFFYELKKALFKELKKNYDIVIHSAAVSDYELPKSYNSKIKSNKKVFKLTLSPTIKLIEQIKKISPKTCLIGFKLESAFKNQKELFKKIDGLLNKSKCDLVVANTTGLFGYKGYLIDQKRRILTKVKSKKELARELIKQLRKT